MSDEMISRTRARTVRLAAQAAAAVLVVGAALLVVVGMPFMLSPVVEPVSNEQVHEKAQKLAQEFAALRPETETDGGLPPDWAAIEFSLMSVKNAPKVKKVDPDSADKSDVEDSPEPTEQEGRTRFLGTITIGKRKLALLSAGGAQRILGPGDSATLALMPGDQGEPPKIEVKLVSDGEVLISENGVDLRVERAARTGFAVSQGSAPDASATPTLSGESGRGGGETIRLDADRPINPDDFRRDDGTIDYESLREAARTRARKRQEQRQKRQDEADKD